MKQRSQGFQVSNRSDDSDDRSATPSLREGREGVADGAILKRGNARVTPYLGMGASAAGEAGWKRGKKEEKVRGHSKGRGRAYIDAVGVVRRVGDAAAAAKRATLPQSGKRYTATGHSTAAGGRRWRAAEELVQ